MKYLEIGRKDSGLFHELANAYYREGEDENTPQEEIDAFIRFLFKKVIERDMEGCFAATDDSCIGFALWTVDREGFAFSELPGSGTILEIGLIPSCRGAGHGKEFVAFIESCLRAKKAKQCYVSAYGPAQEFWVHCGYTQTGKTAGNGLPILAKKL